MRYATTDRYRTDKQPGQGKTKGTGEEPLRISELDETQQGCLRIEKGQDKSRTGIGTSNGFLKTCFLPKMMRANSGEIPVNLKKMEGDYYKSLSKMASYYDIKPMDTQKYGAPYNMLLSERDINRQLGNKLETWDCISIITQGNSFHLVSTERFASQNQLYYIPVVPLFLIMDKPAYGEIAQLMLYVFAYLYHVVAIPYYRQEDSFLFYHYDMAEEWLNDEEDDLLIDRSLKELQIAKRAGDCIESEILARKTLKHFGKAIKDFRAGTEEEVECQSIANEAFSLYSEYPKTTIFKNADQTFDFDSDEIIPMEKYISFCADVSGFVYDELFDCINNELQQCSIIQEPILRRHFDRANLQDLNLDFENRCFTLIERIIIFLEGLKNEI